MKNRFILGIVVVLSLQVCFQVFNALERADNRYFQARATTTVPSLMEAAPIEVAAVPDPEIEASAPIAPTIVRAEVRRPRPVGTAPRFASFRTERKAAPPFETVRITYAQRPAVELTPTAKRITTIARVERPEKNERSVIARAIAPVVKKPYEFIKFVGSKLR